ncbi:hypothetical protein KY285_022377 [Solanum tuberosum]|nr:hypothetical protein KY284_021138 [Solanum tuberosum]KAH0695280.1 hypothetical protein KY285_022377 [Solanum tuberosum]
MVDGSNNVDVEKLISFSKDLVQFLKEDKDVSFLKQCKEQSNALQSHCHTEHQALQNSIQVITDEINDLDHQRDSIEEQRKLLKKIEQDQLRADSFKPKVTNAGKKQRNQMQIITIRVQAKVCPSISPVEFRHHYAKPNIRQSFIVANETQPSPRPCA